MAEQNIQSRKMESMLHRALAAGNVNEEARTIDVTFATETPVRSFRWSIGDFDEILSMKPEHVRMQRLQGGAPVLDNHDRWNGTRSVLGKVENPVLDGVEGRATLRFSKRKDVEEGVWQDVKDKILTGISVGYRVYKYEEVNPDRKQGELPILRAIDWEPTEVSLAPVQADPNSRVRSEKSDEMDVDIVSIAAVATPTPEPEIENRSNTMSNDPNKPNTPEGGAPAPVDLEKVRKQAIEDERARVSAIQDAVRKAKLGEDFAVELVSSGKTIEDARAAIIEKFAAADPNAGQSNMQVTADEADKRREVATAALVLRSGQVQAKDMKPELVEAAREYRGMTLLEMARKSLEDAGVNTRGLDKMELAGRAFTQTGSDFPVLLEGTNRRVLLASYQAVADTWRRFCATGSVGDFREYKRLRLGSLTNLDALGEGREFKNKAISDAEFEKISASTKGNIIAVTREMIVNDDLAGFTRLAAMLGRAAARTIEADVYTLLLSNSGNGPTMADGKALFHTDHGNINATGSALGVTGLDADRVVMASQKDKDGNDFLDLRPSVLLVALGLESTAKVLNTSTYDPDANNKLQKPNTALGMFSDIVGTPRLTGTVRYLFASPSEEPVLEVVFLDGNQSPYMESQMGWRVDGTEWKIRLDFGVGAVGYRGVVRNAGQ
jgi:hypothetical protein